MQGVVLALGSVGLIAATVWAGASIETSPIPIVVAFAIGALGSLVRVPSVEDRRWTLVPALLVSVSLVGIPPWPTTVVVVAGVFTVQSAARLVVGRPTMSVASLGGVCVLFCGLGAIEGIAAVPLVAAPRLTWTELGLVLAVWAAWFALEALLEGWSHRDGKGARRHHVRRGLEDWPIALVALSAAVTFGTLARHSLGWAIALSLVPYAIAHHLGVRVARGRRIADLTVRALGRLPEAAGLAASGHSQGVADLAVAMAKLEGAVGSDLKDLETAAHLHDLGLLATTSPPVRERGFSSSEIAEWGVEMLQPSSSLRPAAAIIGTSRDPFRIPGADPDPDLDHRSQIIQVACRALECVEAGGGIDSAVEELYRHSMYQLDPHVISLVRPAARISQSVLDELTRRRP
ncbi:MAG: HD domain-containing protein [Acidimicrobiia bacterium]